MKKLILSVILSFFIFSNISCVVTPKPIRKAPPPPRKEYVSKKPGPDYVWVKGHWVLRNGLWQWVRGYWIKKKKGKVWVQGHWVKRHGKWVWVPGHWIIKK